MTDDRAERMKCDNCGAECDGSVNGLAFCLQPPCIEAAVKGGTAAGREMRRRIESVLRGATEGGKTDG